MTSRRHPILQVLFLSLWGIIVAMYVRSYFLSDCVWWHRHSTLAPRIWHDTSLTSMNGSLQLTDIDPEDLDETDRGNAGAFRFESRRADRSWLWPGFWLRAGLWFHLSRDVSVMTQLWIPYWPILVAGGVLPTIWGFRRVRQRRRVVLGHCSNCGYDLRGSGLTCPECGNTLTNRQGREKRDRHALQEKSGRQEKPGRF